MPSQMHNVFYQLANAKSSSKSIFTRNIIHLIEYNQKINIYIDQD